MLDIPRLCQPMQVLSANAALLLAVATLGLAPPAEAAQQKMLSANELLAETREARDARQFDRAEQMARQGMSRFHDPVWPLTLSLILADKRKTSEALAVLATPWPGGLPHVERLMAEGYANLRGDNVWAALDAYGAVLLIQPDNAEARHAVTDLLERVRSSAGSADITRWSMTVPLPSPAQRYAETDRRLAKLEASIAAARASLPTDESLVRSLRVDRLIALRDRFRMKEVIAEANGLAAEAPLPPQAMAAMADALLYERKPEEALAAYDAVLRDEPGNPGAEYGRVFSLVEAERFASAIAAADAIAARSRASGDREHVYASMLAAEVRIWSDLAADGHRRLITIAGAEPDNAAVQRSFAGALNARGLNRAAERQAQTAASLDPASFQTRIMLAEYALARRRLDEAAVEADRLAAAYPENRRVQRFAEEVAAARGWALEAELGPKWNDGGGTNASGEEWNSIVRLDTPQIAPRLRLFLLEESNVAHPVEGKVSRHRAAAGIVLRGSDVAATVYVANSWGKIDRGHAGFTISWEINDHISVGAAGETFSRQTPLRALHYGITANSLSGWASWRANESTAISSGIDWLSFTDGNDRLALSLAGEQRIWTRPRLAITGRAALWYSSNSEQGPYFSPEWEASGTAGLTIRHLAWRRYEKLFSHALFADLGIQDQHGFGARWVGSIRYEHRWRWDPWREIYYSFLIDRRVYDGDPERGIGVRLGLRQKF